MFGVRCTVYGQGGKTRPGAILRAWNDLEVLRGHVVEVRAADVSRRGRVAGVDDEGRLVLERGRGAERAIATGDIVSID